MSLHETRQLVDRWLHHAGRKLQAQQRQDVAQHLEESGLPLYLRLAFEELRRWKSYDESRKITGDVPGMIRLLLKRLSSDANHGQLLVSAALASLAAASKGLSEEELLDILSSDKEVLRDCVRRLERESPEDKNELPEDSLPVVIWSRLYFNLEPYLRTVQSDGAFLMSFYHRQFRSVVEKTYLSADPQLSRTHRRIGAYFQRVADPSGDWSWTVKYPRTLNELPYHLYHYGLASKDYQPLLDLVENGAFKKLQFEHFGLPDPLTKDIAYAMDLTIKKKDPVGIIHYALMRSRLPGKFYRSYLYRLAMLAPEKPELALAVVRLLPAPELRRLALVFLAWLFSQDDRKSTSVDEILAMAVTIAIPAAVAHVPLLMEMMLKLYQRGFTRSTELAGAIPDCPVARFYHDAWKGSGGPAREIASRITPYVHSAEDSDIEEFAKIQEGLSQLETRLQGINSHRTMAAFEEQLADQFGLSGAASAYFLLATAQINSGRQANAASLINRGLYVVSATPNYAIRMLAALAEGCGRTGEEDLAAEHMARIRTLVAGSRRALVKTESEQWFLEDAQVELGISVERLSPSWRPLKVNQMFEAGLAQRVSTSRGDRLAVAHLVTNARQLLAEGHLSAVPPILTQICARLESGEVVDHPDAVTIAGFAMAYVCDDRGIMSRSTALLQGKNLQPQCLFSAPQSSAELRSLLELLVGSESPYVAAVAQCLGLCNRRETLFEFARQASVAGAELAILDAAMVEIIRDPTLSSDDLRKISSEVTSDFRHFVIAQGLGIYYYPVALLAALWGGVVLGSAGLASALSSWTVVSVGAIILAGGLVGGLSDLALWHIIGLWEKPEKSMRWWSEAGTLAGLLFTFELFRWIPAVPRDAPLVIGLAVPLVSAAGVFIFLVRTGWLFTLPKFLTIVAGSATAILGALIFGMIASTIGNGEFLTHLLQGIFLSAAGFMAVALNILPKHVAARRFYGTKGSLEEPDMDC